MKVDIMRKYILLIIVSTIGLTLHLSANPLVPCVEGGDYNSVARLIRGGADVNGHGSWTPLALAALKGYKDIVKLLLENGANPNLRGRECERPLLTCAQGLGNWYAAGRVEDYACIAQFLIDAGADVNGATKQGDVALDFVVSCKEVNPFVDVLLKNGANISFLRPSVQAETRAYLEKRQRELMAEKEKIEKEKIVNEAPVEVSLSLDIEATEGSVKQAPETTPWDDLPFGKHSGRLHILQQLLKSAKKSEKKTLMVMLQAEIGHLFDMLYYDLKRAQALLDKAYSESKKNPEAEKERVEAQKHLTALEYYLKSLPKVDRCKVNAIYLPSKYWIPAPK